MAHPDDESFGPGGTLCKYASSGTEIHLVTATLGEAGKIADPAVCTPEKLGECRKEELLNAAKIIGIKNVVFLGYKDKHVEEAIEDEIVEMLVRTIRELKPDVIITFEKNGISGHPDHIAMHNFTNTAYVKAADEKEFSEQLNEGLSPHKAKKLYYYCVPDGIRGKVPVNRLNLTPMENVTTIINVREFVEQKLKAIECHKTQALSLRRYKDLTREQLIEIRSKEYFILSDLSEIKPDGNEEDLLQGIV